MPRIVHTWDAQDHAAWSRGWQDEPRLSVALPNAGVAAASLRGAVVTHDSSTAALGSHAVGTGRWSVRRLVVGVVMMLAGAVGWGGWWWSHPGVFDPAPDSWSVGGGESVSAGGPAIHIGMTYPSDGASEAVTIIKAAPHVLVNTAGARITFEICSVRPGGPAIASSTGDLRKYCSRVKPVADAKLPLRRNRSVQQVMMTIAADHPGAIRVQGMDLTYRRGIQYGTQRVGEYVWLRFN